MLRLRAASTCLVRRFLLRCRGSTTDCRRGRRGSAPHWPQVVLALVGDRCRASVTPSWAAMKIHAAGGSCTVAAEDTSDDPGKPGRQACRPCHASPRQKRLHIVAETVVPFKKIVRLKIAELVAARSDVPRLGYHHAIPESFVFGPDRSAASVHRRENRGRIAAQDRRQVEAETIDAGVAHEVRAAYPAPARCTDRDGRMPIVWPVPVSLTSRVVGERDGSRSAHQGRAARASDQAQSLSARVVEDEVEDHAYAGLAQRRHRLPQFRRCHPARAAGPAP
jgi:hypothetical protein